jgi:GNAT superfamily N-acetyltransferase
VAIEIRPLREADDRTTFRSGDPDLDRFFVRYAGQNQFRHHIGTTYVAVEADRALGYATVAPGNLEAGALPITVRRTLPRYPLPVLRLARLAVDATAQGRGVGATLLRHVFLLALQMSQEYGCIGTIVDAKRSAVEFYARFGFSPLEISEGEIEARPKPTPLFLPLELIAAALVP